MVSIVLLTTEEVLQRNRFWYCLDAVWITEEMEPFEEVKPEHVYSKPVSRDFYYAKYPDIPRSESEDENSITVSGFKSKHHEWKSKICIRRFDAKRRSSNCSFKSQNSNPSLNDVSRRVTSLVDRSKELCTARVALRNESNDEKVRAFFNRLLQSVPPPPIEYLQETINSVNSSLLPSSPRNDEELNDLELPNYDDFEKDKMIQSDTNVLPGTSTLKRNQRRVSFDTNSFKADFEHCDTWFENIYGVSDLLGIDTKSNSLGDEETSIGEFDEELDDPTNSASWSDIVSRYGLDNSIVRSEESLELMDEIISKSHCGDVVMSDVSQDDDDDSGYARFAVYKIYQSLKIDDGMTDSSSMKNFDGDNNEDNIEDKLFKSTLSFHGSVYRLAPIDDIDASVKVALT